MSIAIGDDESAIREVLAQIQKVRDHMSDKGGLLLDGRTLPPSTVRIETRLLG